MGRNKKNPEDKKVTFGVTMHPEIVKLLEEMVEDKNTSRSKLIEDVMKKYLNIEDEKNKEE